MERLRSPAFAAEEECPKSEAQQRDGSGFRHGGDGETPALEGGGIACGLVGDEEFPGAVAVEAIEGGQHGGVASVLRTSCGSMFRPSG